MLLAEIVGGPEANRAEDVVEARLALEVGVIRQLSALRTDDAALALVKDLVLFDELGLVLPAHQPTRPPDCPDRNHPVVGFLYMQV